VRQDYDSFFMKIEKGKKFRCNIILFYFLLHVKKKTGNKKNLIPGDTPEKLQYFQTNEA
jgi:hypothetical protein